MAKRRKDEAKPVGLSRYRWWLRHTVSPLAIVAHARAKLIDRQIHAKARSA